MKIIQLLPSKEAVSEALDFAVLLGVILISISLIGVAGYPILKKVQESNYIENTKQSFIVLAERVNKVVLGQAPSQSVELKLYGGTLSVDMSSNITVNLTNSTGGAETFYGEGSIESTIDSTIIAYEGTGVWANYQNVNTLMVSKPLISNQSNVLLIPVVSILGTSSIGGAGTGWVNVCEQGCTPQIYYYGNVSNIIVTINSKYADGWYNYFKNSLSWNCQLPQRGSVTCTAPNANNVYILYAPLTTEVV